MLNLTIQSAPANSKGITQVVHANGISVGHCRETDTAQFLLDLAEVNSKPLQMEFKDYGDCQFYTGTVLMRRKLGRTVVYWEYSIGVSPRGDILTHDNRSYFANQTSGCLSAHYERPKALKIVGDDGIIETPHGSFRVMVTGFDRVSIEKA